MLIAIQNTIFFIYLFLLLTIQIIIPTKIIIIGIPNIINFTILSANAVGVFVNAFVVEEYF